MTGAPRGQWRRMGPALVLGAACVAAIALLTPSPARAFLWAGAFAAVSVLAGLLLATLERRARTLEQAYRGVLDIMSRVIDSVERCSDNHSRRVAESSVEVAHALGCSEAEVEDIRVAALMHDLGRLDIPAESLAQAAGLPPQELDDVRGFGARPGVRARAAEETLRRVLPIVICHAERWDGTGRRSLKGEEVPLGSRILAIADAYDMAVTDRPYRRGATPEQALAMLEETSGRQFDPRVVEVFVSLRRAGAADGAERRTA